MVSFGSLYVSLTKNAPFFHSIDLKVDPPYARDSEYEPQCGLFTQRADWEPLKYKEIAQCDSEENGQAEEEEKDVEG